MSLSKGLTRAGNPRLAILPGVPRPILSPEGVVREPPVLQVLPFARTFDAIVPTRKILDGALAPP